MARLSPKWSTCLVCVELSYFDTKSLVESKLMCVYDCKIVRILPKKGKRNEIKKALIVSFGFLLKRKERECKLMRKMQNIFKK